MPEKQGLSRRFRGLNIRQVEEHIEKLSRQHESELADLLQKLELAASEKNRLHQLLTDKQTERERLTRSKELLSFALGRAKEAGSLFQAKAREEAEDLLRSAKQQNENNEWKLQSVEQEISIAKKHVESLLAEMTKIFRDEKDSPEQQIDEAALSKVAGKIFPAVALKKNYVKLTEQKHEETLAAAVGSVEKEQEEWAAEEKKMTADGAVAEPPAARKITTDVKSANINPPLKLDKGAVSRSADGAGGDESFWDEGPEQPDYVVPLADKIVTAANDLVKKAGIEENELAAAQPPAEKNTPNCTAVNPEKDEPALRAGAAQADDSFGGSTAISAEISSIRHKYIVGKVAGDNLYANDGSLIIARNNTITTEVVIKAEAEGKLPELIVSMILPGMEA